MQINSVSLRGRDIQTHRKMKPTTGQRRTYRQPLALGWGGGGVKPTVALSLPLGGPGPGAGARGQVSFSETGDGAVVLSSFHPGGGAGTHHSKTPNNPSGGIKTAPPLSKKNRFPNRGVARQTL